LAARIDERVERMAELGLGRLALQELQVVDERTSMDRTASLNAIAFWARSAETKPYMNFSAVR